MEPGSFLEGSPLAADKRQLSKQTIPVAGSWPGVLLRRKRLVPVLQLKVAGAVNPVEMTNELESK